MVAEAGVCGCGVDTCEQAQTAMFRSSDWQRVEKCRMSLLEKLRNKKMTQKTDYKTV